MRKQRLKITSISSDTVVMFNILMCCFNRTAKKNPKNNFKVLTMTFSQSSFLKT